MKRLMSYFLKGLLFVVPSVVTIYVVYVVFIKIDGILHIPIPGVGFVITLFLITLVGFFASNILAKSVLKIIDNIFKRLPFVKLLYSSAKDLMDAFVGDKKIFDKPVLVTLSSDSDVKILGFITKENLDTLGIQNSVAVYIPQAYNFAGNLLIVPRDRLTPIDKDGPEVMAFIVSAGITGK
ncbi:MAG: DUF502 domain-containing protein [Planctomycetota bacterium]